MLSVQWIVSFKYYFKKCLQRRRRRNPENPDPDDEPSDDFGPSDVPLIVCNDGGEWWGSGALLLGLRGRVRPEQFAWLFHGCRPGGRPLVQNAGSLSRQAGWDLTFSAPKSVSVLWSAVDDGTRLRIEAAHRRAVEAALRYIEEVAIFTRRGKGGTRIEHAMPVVAVFPEATSRELDPQLHSHCVVLNVAARGDHTIGTILSKPLFTYKHTAGAIYQIEYSSILKNELGIRIERDKTAFRVSGVPQELVDHFSTRSKQIRAALRSKGYHTAKAAAVAAVDTRKAVIDPPPLEVLLDEWRRTNSEFGFGEAKAVGLLNRVSALKEVPDLTAHISRALSELLEIESFFSEQELIRQVARAVMAEGVSATEIIDQVRTFLVGNPNLVPLTSKDRDLLYTTPAVIALETRLLQTIAAGKTDKSHVVRESIAKAILDRELPLHEFLTEDERIRNEEQRNAVTQVTTVPGTVQVIEGMAGTGKTYTLNVARQIWSRAGFRVTGVALSAAAAGNLQEGAGIECDTIAMRLAQLNRKGDFAYHHQKQLKRLLQGKRTHSYRGRKFTLDAKTILVVDEAAMNGTKQLAELVFHAVKVGAKIVLIGDRRQVQPIEAGCPFATIADLVGKAELNHVVRQKIQPDDPNPVWHREAGRLIAAGHVPQALTLFKERGRLSILEGRDEAMMSLARDWSVEGIRDPARHVVLAGTRAEVDTLNRLCQEARFSAGALKGTAVRIADREFLAGDVVLCTRNSRLLNVKNGDRGTIQSFNRLRGLVTIRLQRTGKPVVIPYRSYQDLDLGYAMTTHKAQGATVPNVYILLGGPLQDRHLSYVQMTRASESTRLYTDTQNAGNKLEHLISQVERQRPKLLALDLIPPCASDEDIPPGDTATDQTTSDSAQGTPQPNIQNGSNGEPLKREMATPPDQATVSVNPEDTTSPPSPAERQEDGVSITPPLAESTVAHPQEGPATQVVQPPADQPASTTTPPAKRRRGSGGTRPKKAATKESTALPPFPDILKSDDVQLRPNIEPQPERRDLLDLSHVAVGMTTEPQPLIAAAKRYGRVPGGIVIEGTASSEVPIESLAIDTAHPHRLRVNGTLSFDTGLSSEEVAILWNAVFQTGEAEKNFGVISQVEPIGVNSDTVVAHTMMSADNALGGIIYGVDAQCSLGRSSVPSYLNPFLFELTQLEEDTAIERLFFNEFLEVHPRVFLTISNVGFAKKGGNSLGIASINAQAALGTMQRNEVVTLSPPESDLPLVSIRFPHVNRACSHFVRHFREFAREEPTFARTLAYAELVCLFRLAKSSGASLATNELASQIMAKRRRMPRPRFDFTMRSGTYVDALAEASRRLGERPQANLVLGSMEGFLAMTFAFRAGDMDLFLSAKRKALGFTSRYRDLVRWDRHDKFGEYVPALVERIRDTPHDFLIESCFARARENDRPLVEREAFLEEALGLCGSPAMAAQNIATRCLQLEIECYRNPELDPLPELAGLRAKDPLCGFPYTVLWRINSRRLNGECLPHGPEPVRLGFGLDHDQEKAFDRMVQRRLTDLGLRSLNDRDKVLWTAVEAKLWSGDRLQFLETLEHLNAPLAEYVAAYRKHQNFHPMAVLTKLVASRLKHMPPTFFSPHLLHRNNPFHRSHELLDLEKPKNIEALFRPLWQNLAIFNFPFEIWEPTSRLERFLAYCRRPTVKKWCEAFLKLHAVSQDVRGSKVALLLAHELKARRLKVTELYEKMRQYRTKNPQAAFFLIEVDQARPYPPARPKPSQ